MQIEVVELGESLWTISRRYGVEVKEIARLNEMDPNASLVIGQALLIPAPEIYIVQPGDSIVANAYLNPSDSDRSMQLVKESADALSYFSIFQYNVTRDGDLVPPNDEIALTSIRDTNAVPMMVITNLEEGAFSPELARAIFHSISKENRLIENVLNIMQQKGFVALNIDFENIYPADRYLYNAFLRKITERLHGAGSYQVSTVLAPKVSSEQVGQLYEAHDYPAHGQIVDFVIIITYGWGWSGGPPMAVAPIPEINRVLDYAVSVIPSNKILMGAPLFGFDWTLPYNPEVSWARTLSPKDAVDLARRVNAAIEYDYTLQAPHFTYYDEEKKEHAVWFEDARSMQAKFDVLRQFGLRGISYWMLGYSFPQNLPLLKANFNIIKYK